MVEAWKYKKLLYAKLDCGTIFERWRFAALNLRTRGLFSRRKFYRMIYTIRIYKMHNCDLIYQCPQMLLAQEEENNLLRNTSNAFTLAERRWLLV